MALEHAELALDAAETLIKATAFDIAASALMTASSLWRQSVPGMAMTPDMAKRVDAFTIRSLTIRETINTARSAFTQGPR